MGIIFAISTTEKERNGHENFSDREVLFLILEIDFPLRRNYTDSWHRNVWGTRIRLFIVPDDSVFRTCTIYYRVNFQQKNKNGVSMGDTRKEEAEFSLRKKYHKTIFSRFARAINTYRLVEDGDHVAVCIAQGGNGLILAKCFQEIKRHRKIDFEVDFFSFEEENNGKFIRIAEETGIPVQKLHSVDDVKNSGCNKLAVADCYEDVIEMILTGVLYRGEISTLMPKEKERDFGGIEVIRPFYLVHKQDLKEWNMEFGMVTGTKEDFSDQQEEVKRLLEEFENYIVGEVILPINHYLVGTENTTLESIERVYSHPQALMQCGRYLESHREWEKHSLKNTAMAAKKVKEDGKKHKAAIASSLTADIYGLKVLDECIQDNKMNATRFIIVSGKRVFTSKAEKISICFEGMHESGSLYHMLSHFIYNGINMNHIESRPVQGKNWEYRFFVDFEGNLNDAAVQNALRGLAEETLGLKILGNY